MEHEEFVAKNSAEEAVWRGWTVNGLIPAIFLVRGIPGVLGFVFWALIVHMPVAVFAALSGSRGQYGAMIWTLPALFAFLVAPTNVNAIQGIPFFLCIPAGAVISAWFGRLHLWGGLLPIVIYYLSGALKGVAMEGMERRLMESKGSFDRLNASGRLVILS